MENNNNDIDKLFKDQLDGHQADYVPGAWEKMEAMLDADEGTAWLHNTQRFVLASIAGAILLAGSVMAYIAGGPADGSLATTGSANENTVIQQQPQQGDKNSSSGAGNVMLKDITGETGQNNSTINNSTDNSIDKPAGKSSSGGASNTAANNHLTRKNAPVKAPVVAATEPLPVITGDEEKENTEEMLPALADAPQQPTVLLAGLNPLKLLKPLGDNLYLENFELNAALLDSAQKARKTVQEMARFYGWQLGVYAGLNFNKAISTVDDKLNAGTGFLGGITLSKNWNKHWGFSADVNYLRRTGNTITRSVDQTRYFFEKTTTSYLLITKTMDVIQLPVAIHYNLTRKHIFSLGAMAAWMIDSKTDVNVRTENTSEKTSDKQTKNGVYEDMRRFGYGLWAGYEFKVAGMYSLGLRYNQQLNSITKSSFFTDGKKHLPADLQLYIKLNLNR